MLSESRTLLFDNPWAALGPGIALVLTAASMNVVGDWLFERLSERGQVAVSAPLAVEVRCASHVESAQPGRSSTRSTSTSPPGETVGIVGESGSGKSMTARALVGLLPPGVHARAGSVRLARARAARRRRERDVAARSAAAEIALLLQDPFTMLNPLMPVGAQIVETVRDAAGGGCRARRAARRRCAGSPRSASPTRASPTATRSSSPAACASASGSPPRSRATPSC